MLSSLVGEPYDRFFSRLTERDRSFVWLKRKVSGEALDGVLKLNDEGLIKVNEPLRHFEYGETGSQVIGTTNVDNVGLSGIELYYNDVLRGRDGYVVMQRDARGHRRPDVDLPRLDPEHGSGLELTIDITMQGIVEEELRSGVESAGAASGTAIAVDPRTGEILAIASYPSYDPNRISIADPSAMRVRAITDMYEPGSTMKAITAAAAIEEKAVGLDEMIDGENGEYHLANHTIRDDHPAGQMTFRQAIEESSNIAFAKIAARLAPPRFYKYVRDFGFGIVSGVDLPGEARGDVKKPDDFGPETEAVMAFGYQLAVTPLQLVTAYAAIANGGSMMKPHLLRRRLDRNGEVVEQIEPERIRQVVSPETAAIVRNLLVGVVERGTGQLARIPGLRIAGKTGTSQQLAGGSYSKENYNASFVGFFPAEDPHVTLLVLLDSPKNGYYGGQVAAPIFREIARRFVNASMQQSEPRLEQASMSIDSSTPLRVGTSLRVPDLRGLPTEDARSIAGHYGLRVVLHGRGGIVAAQNPPLGEPVRAHDVITLETDLAMPERVPDVRGMSLRRAVNVLNRYRLTPHATGSGRVRVQIPGAGTIASRTQRNVTLQCE
jgi:cell division protein FtsI (penicillin-binding protein 3)